MAEERFSSGDTRNLLLAVLENWKSILAPHGEAEGLGENRELDNLKARFAGRVG